MELGKMMMLLKESSALTIPELAEKIEKSASATERAVRKLRQAGRLRRVGPAKGGHWEVMEE
jgi:predicted transcriptional regulator